MALKLDIKFDMNMVCKVILQDHLDDLGVPYEISGLGEVQITGKISTEQYKTLEQSLHRYGIEIIDDPRNAMAQKIKDIIIQMVYMDDKLPESKISAYISNKMKLSYAQLSILFSEVTFSSIENFIILQRIERAKQMLIEEKLTISEVAWKLNYSSSAHLSNQFKKVTGLTPTAFQRIIEKRNSLIFHSLKE